MNRKVYLLTIGFLIFLIGPFLILFFFNNPTPEDFSWSETTRNLGYIDAQRFYYNIWSGRYFSYLVLSINPLLFKSLEGYKIFLLLFFLLFNYLIFLFISNFTKDILTFSERLLLTLSFIFLYLYAMPSVSEGFYWLTAVMIYHVGIMLLMLLLILFKKLESTESVPLRVICTLIAVLIIAAAAGTSELTSMLTFLLAGIFLIRAFLF
ncbi:MAG: hypothetical protein M3P82_00075, partial [Bacteroidota bacterium]|nr:hypothetical protein [Bacteroidota bacterium]